MEERAGGLVVTEIVTDLTLDLVALVPLVVVASIEEEEEAEAAAVVLLGDKPYTIQPLDAPTWIALWHPASATRPAPTSRPKSA